MYIMCVCLFNALSRRVGALQISIIIIIKSSQQSQARSYRDAIERAGEVVAQASNLSSVGVLIEGILEELHKQRVQVGVQGVNVGVGAGDKE